MTYIIYPEATHATGQLGGKAGALAALRHTGLPIPAWIALSPSAFYDSLSDTQRESLSTTAPDSAKILSLLHNLKPNLAVQVELEQALANLCPNGEPVAVRSSALDEDGIQFSFAGQLDSFLDVPSQEAPDKVAEVWKSGFSRRILAYRRKHGLSLIPRPPAVLIQRMVKADLSGVAFSADPVAGRRDVAVVGAVCGLGSALVSGEADADTYYVDRQGQIIDRTEEQAGQPALDEAQIQAVANLARRTEQFFGRPQDIEWAIEGEQLYLLQSRPITTLTHLPDPDGALNLWDNSNIAESYPGLTTPLTFSFARRAYEEVYRQFCRLMGVPAETIAGNATTFRRMLGLMQGRIYYNLLSWYRVLAMLPGYKANRRFMEQMMGVKESLPDELLAGQSPPTRRARLWDGIRLLRTMVGLIANYALLPRRIDAFYLRLNRALGAGRPDLSGLRADELVTYYRDLERQLLTRWDAPLVNDFFAMIFYGLLRKMTAAWCDDAGGALQNALLANTGGIISAEPIAHLRQMAQLAATDPAFVAALGDGSLPEILAHMPKLPRFEVQYQAYLDKFGDRCLAELKLESPTLHDDPLILLRTIGQLARQVAAREREAKIFSPQSSIPNSQGGCSATNRHLRPITNYPQAEQRVRNALARHPLRRALFNWALKNARILIRNRENLRFERTRLFGRVRLIFVELGRRFHALDLLSDPRDIFYLEVEEALGFVDGTTTTTDLRGLIALRQAEFERYRTMEPPPDRFETRGIPYQGVQCRVSSVQCQVSGLDVQSRNLDITTKIVLDEKKIENRKSKIENRMSLKGLGCCPGVVRGQVRVVTNPKTAALQPGEILVAERTDPGWIMLFPAAAGLLVEHGSLLSHSAIVSREIGLPAIVSLKGVMRWLRDGDWVEIDGSTGVVRKIGEK